MPFWRSWAASLVGASGAAVAVAVGLVLTVVVAAAVSGGGGRFGGLAQLTSGPRIPGVAGDGARTSAPLDGGLPALPRSARHHRARGTHAVPRAASSWAAGGGTNTRAPTSTTETLTVAPTAPRRPGGGSGKTPTLTTPATTPAPAGTAPAPAAAPDPLRKTVKNLQGAIAPLPVLGAPVADAVGTVADLILPPASGGKSTAAAPATP